MELHHAFGAGARVEAVHVLRRQEEVAAARGDDLLQLRERVVAGVRLHVLHYGAAVGVPALHERRVFEEGADVRQLFGLEPLPEPVGVAERRHAALGGDAGAGEDADAPGVAEAVDEAGGEVHSGQDWWAAACWAACCSMR